MAAGVQRFARQQIERPAPGALEAEQATITAVSTDTPAQVTVTYKGADYTGYPYLPPYTPVVGHVVAMIPYCGSWLILGRPDGFAP